MRRLWNRLRGWWGSLSGLQRVGVVLGLALAVVWVVQRAPSGWIVLGDDPTWEAITRDGMVHVGMDASYPPFENVDADGQFVGLDVDLARALGERWGVEVVLVNIHFDGLYDAMEAGKVDLIVSALPHDRMMTQDVLYSASYFNAGLVLMAPSGGVVSVQDLDTRAVAVELGAQAHQQAKLLQRDHGLDLEILPVREPEEVLQAVVDGRADALVCDRVTAYSYLRAAPEMAMVDPPLTDEPLVIAAPFGSLRTMAEVNSALAEWQSDGTLAGWQEAWLR